MTLLSGVRYADVVVWIRLKLFSDSAVVGSEFKPLGLNRDGNRSQNLFEFSLFNPGLHHLSLALDSHLCLWEHDILIAVLVHVIIAVTKKVSNVYAPSSSCPDPIGKRNIL